MLPSRATLHRPQIDCEEALIQCDSEDPSTQFFRVKTVPSVIKSFIRQFLSREDIKLALLVCATRWSVVARSMCLEWAPSKVRAGLPNEVSGSVLGVQELKSSGSVESLHCLRPAASMEGCRAAIPQVWHPGVPPGGSGTTQVCGRVVSSFPYVLGREGPYCELVGPYFPQTSAFSAECGWPRPSFFLYLSISFSNFDAIASQAWL